LPNLCTNLHKKNDFQTFFKSTVFTLLVWEKPFFHLFL
jgi:hypothetical protein